jgi:hypothetical protein
MPTVIIDATGNLKSDQQCLSIHGSWRQIYFNWTTERKIFLSAILNFIKEKAA